MRAYVGVGLALSLSGCISAVHTPGTDTAPRTSVVEARRTISELGPQVSLGAYSFKLGGFRFDGTVANIVATRTHFFVNGQAAGREVTFRCPAGRIQVKDAISGIWVSLNANVDAVWFVCEREDARDDRNVIFGLKLKTQEEAARFADAVYVVGRWARGDTTLQYESFESAQQFEVAVKRAESMPARSPLPEEARRHAVQAATAVEAKRYEDAIDSYERALVHAPWWKDGYFNLSLLYAERKMYMDAIHTMRKYVRLSPADARVAQDKIYEWEAQAKF